MWKPLEEGTLSISKQEFIEPHNKNWLAVGMRLKTEAGFGAWQIAEVRLPDNVRVCMDSPTTDSPQGVSIPLESLLFLCHYSQPLGANEKEWADHRSKVYAWVDNK